MMRVWRLTSVCLSRTSGLSREQRGLGRLKIGTEVAHVTRDSGISFKVKRSRSTCGGGCILWRPPAQLVLVYLSVLAKRLASKSPLMTRLVSRRDYLHKDQVEQCVFVYFFRFVCLCYCVFVPRTYTIYFIRPWHDIAYLCWKCRSTPTNQPLPSVVLLRAPRRVDSIHRWRSSPAVL